MTEPGKSLRRRILTVGAALGLLLLGVLVATAALSMQARGELASVTQDFLEEQRIGDRITRAALRQVAATTILRPSGATPLEEGFQEAGDEVHREIRRYLFRDLSPEERLQLERMGEEHQRMEVAASQASELLRREAVAAAAEARAAMFLHLSGFLTSTDEFIRMREDRLSELQVRQEETFRYLYLGGTGIAFLLLLGGLVLAWLLHRRIARPLEGLADATERLGTGDLSVRLSEGEDREFRVVARGFNRMAENLERTTGDLERRNRELSEAIGTLQEAQAALIQAEKLSAMGRMAGGLAHELNNPLSGVVGYSQLLKEELEVRGAIPEEELRKDFVVPMLRESRRAQRLVRSFLQFARDSRARLEPVPLRPALEEVVELREPAFQEAGVALELGEVPEVRVLAEVEMLQAIFLNLVNNALDALRSQGGAGRLAIRGQEAEGRLRLIFEDDGPGLQQPDRVFEPFFTTKPVGEGTGLGLSLAHRFATSFGGDLWGVNRASGGARFVVELVVAEEGSFGVEPDAGARPESGALAGAAAAPQAATEGMLAAGGEVAPSILVVEDEEPIRELHERLLLRMGNRVHLAASAAEAREILARERVDVILCDVKMPGESGLDFYRRLRREDPARVEAFLFVTGDVSAPELVELAEERPELFLHKPFDVADYQARVRELVGVGVRG